MIAVKTLELVVRPLQAVQFTEENYAEVRQWVQDKITFQEVVATGTRLYLPSVGGIEVLVPGDWVLYDEKDNAFRAATDEAVTNFYQEVPDVA